MYILILIFKGCIFSGKYEAYGKFNLVSINLDNFSGVTTALFDLLSYGAEWLNNDKQL